MKYVGIVLVVIAVVWFILGVRAEIIRYYEYQNKYQSYWELADKSSTIEEKSNYINKFVNALINSGLEGENDAIIYKIPTNSFDNNLRALKSLQQRLEEIKTMDIKSFEYQTAIQQITAQEQGEAVAMLDVLHGCWVKSNYPLLWDWIGAIFWTVWVLFTCFGCLLIAAGWND